MQNWVKEIVVDSKFENASIGDRAFRGCSALKELALPKALRVVGDEAFFACANLEKLT
ncbi:MAG: leucine-rich repeat protein, partial [Fibrobacter sp.]|nr:leucine-rich repeat protein [Fibrobacter sp.]